MQFQASLGELAMAPIFNFPRRVEFAETDAAGIVHFSVFFLFITSRARILASPRFERFPNDYVHWRG